LLDQLGADVRKAVGIGQHEGVIANLIDEPRHAVGGAVNRVEGLGMKQRVGRGIAGGDLSADECGGVVARERFQVAPRRQALGERFELGVREVLFQRRPAGENQPHGRLSFATEVGEGAEFVEQPR
jgi:hypothetical protein